MSIDDSIIRKTILNERYAGTLARRYEQEIRAMLDRVTARMLREPNNTRLQAIQSDLNRIMEIGFADLQSQMITDAEEFIQDETEFIDRVMNLNSSAVLRAPQFSTLQSALWNNDLDIISGAGTLNFRDFMLRFSASNTNAVRRIIFDGILAGDSIPEMVKQIEALGTGRTRAQTRAVARTMVNFSSSQAMRAYVGSNASLYDGEEWRSVLDSRTTLICGGRSGRIYPVGKGPYPPAHYQCRSKRIPRLKRDFDTQTMKSKKQDFDSWLRDQPKSFQEEYFSDQPYAAEKLALFRSGDLKIEQFRDETNKVYTRDQLKALYPEAFKRAGID